MKDKIYGSIIVEDEAYMLLRKNTDFDGNSILFKTVSQTINSNAITIKIGILS